MKKIYGLIGYPVKHSLSPVMHNAAFGYLGINAEYRLFEVKPDELKDFLAGLEKKAQGINITIPHKEVSMQYLDAVKKEAAMVGAVNTVVLEKGKLVGYNTDILGFIEAIDKDLSFMASGKKAVVFGAGGASRAVCFGLHSLSIKEIVLIDLDTRKAASLAIDLVKAGCNAMAIVRDKDVIGNLVLNSDIIVNASPCGMKEGDARLFDPKFLLRQPAVFDLIYNPEETLLIKDARRIGCKAINGVPMLLYQGMKAFELWTGQRPDFTIIKEALCRSLRSV